MYKIILTTTLLLVAVFSVAYLYFSNLNVGGRNNNKALSLIPGEAALVFTFKNDKGFYEIFNDYPIFDAITGDENKAELRALKNILLGNRQIGKVSTGQNVFLSFHPNKADSLDFLWLMPLQKDLSAQDLKSALADYKKVNVETEQFQNQEIYKLKLSGLNRLFYLSINKGIAAGSFSKELLAHYLDKKASKISEDFIKEISTQSARNRDAAANVFINLKGSIPFLSPFFNSKLAGNFALLNNLAGYSSLNLNFKSDALMFNGITNTDTLQPAYLNIFLHQDAVQNPIKRIVPENTASFIAFGLSNYTRFNNDLQIYLKQKNELEKLREQISTIAKETGISPDRDIRRFWGNEFITFQLSTQEKLGAIRLNNGQKLQFFLEPLSSEYSENIRRLDYPDLLYYYFGDPFKHFTKPFYSIIDNQLIVANSPGTVQRFLNEYNAEKLLVNTSRFSEFDQLVADRSNVLVFIHIKNSGSIISNLLKPAYAQNFKSKKYGLKDFYGISYQWSSDSGHFFTNFYAVYKETLSTSNSFENADSLINSKK